jgi:integrase
LRRARKQKLCVVFNKARSTWNWLTLEAGHRRSRKLGTLAELPTKADALRRAEDVHRELHLHVERSVPTVSKLVEQYRLEKMPRRHDTRRAYDVWIRNYMLPKWGGSTLSDIQARPVELWLDSLTLAPKSKVHIRGTLSLLWDFAMWRGDVLISETR